MSRPIVVSLLVVSMLFSGVVLAAYEDTPRGSDSQAILRTLAEVQPKMVKVYGAGGYQGMESYQSGFLISPRGHILTVWSYVLDTEYLSVTLADGRKFEAKLLGADPRLEVAVLKIDATELPCFELPKAVEGEAGCRILALSNLFGVATGNEPASVQHGTISVKTTLEARRGAFETPYHGPIYVLDVVTNNPGAAGGALVTRRGELLAMLGKELRNSLNNTWLNYAVPIGQLRESVELILAGKFVARSAEDAKKPAKGLTPAMLGIAMVPDVMDRTPPYIDQVIPGSSAQGAGLRADDLVVLVGDRLVGSCKSLRNELSSIDFEEKVKLTILRSQEMIECVLQATPTTKRTSP